MSSDTSKRYALRGVSAGKEDVHNAIKNIDKDYFLRRSVKLFLITLPKTRDCLIMHADGAGTKSSLACTGKKQVIYQYGRLPGCINHEY
jgi:phosphoribosylformylglycinamidine cyclo-ligase